MVFVTTYTVFFVLILFVGCHPFAANLYYYDVTWMAEHAPEASCWTQPINFALTTVCGSLSVFTDWYSVMLPAVLILRIRMIVRQKYGLIFIFGMGYMYAPSYLD